MIKTETAMTIAVALAGFAAGALTAVLFFWACLEPIA